ncbi:hypothetical protein [Polyangium jinanense]|uniref:SspI n=1 Tax=Polyangium jinanense TaxID=2829994 RepID=A0A9X4ASE0_9BACT|nr:hypothetical protein [Polyangium jinanense]MDC3958614.1 hypothetical protein [Polyangium jinanense]MDC3983078.1 hypothetical protein [Polyangium jinanense]
MTPYKEFTTRLTLLISKNPHLITTTLSNIFTMRLIGNKTHGDLAEIAIAEFINQYMYDFKSVHVGKDLYRAKEHEEDIKIINEITKAEFPVSLKAYGDGPLQLSTDKNFLMYPKLQQMKSPIQGAQLSALWRDPVFADFSALNVLPLIYDERRQRCNILVFDQEKAKEQIAKIVHEEEGKGRKHPVYRFYDRTGDYVCEVRYGSGTANALQRGLWTNTKKGLKYFDSVTGGWITYSRNQILVKLFSHALLATSSGHEAALEELKKDIETQKKMSALG